MFMIMFSRDPVGYSEDYLDDVCNKPILLRDLSGSFPQDTICSCCYDGFFLYNRAFSSIRKGIRMISRAVFDIETVGLLKYDGSPFVVHCMCIQDFDTEEMFSYVGYDEILKGIDVLNSSSLVIGHNICGFDLQYLLEYTGVEVTTSPRDTYILSKMFNPDQQSHSLDYYGKLFGRLKPEHEDWSTYSLEMLHRCKEDVAITTKLYKRMIDKELSIYDSWIPALLLEQDFQKYQVLQEREGVDIDLELLHRVVGEIDLEICNIDEKLESVLPMKVVSNGVVNKPFKINGELSEMAKNYIELVNKEEEL